MMQDVFICVKVCNFDTISVCECVCVHANLNEFILDALCPLQLCLNHLDELCCPVFCPNITETSFLKELHGEQTEEVK